MTMYRLFKTLTVFGALSFDAGAALAQPAPAAPRSPAAPAAPAAVAAPASPALPPEPQVWTLPGHDVQLRDVAANVIVTPENRTDTRIEIVNPGPLPNPAVRRAGDRLIVDGGLRRDINRCRTENGRFAVSVDHHGWVDERQLPVIQISLPQDAALRVDGGARVWVGPAQNLDFEMSACGEANIDSVANSAQIAVTGRDAELRLLEAGDASLRLAGAGDIELGVMHKSLALSIAGAGDVNVARADGPINIAIQGSGDVTIREGDATTFSVAIAGAGDVNFLGQADSLDAAIFGAGDVHVRRVDGNVTKRIFGGGDISVGP